MHFVNQTPFQASTILALDRDAAETLAVVVKAPYDVGRGRPQPSEKPDPIVGADEYTGEPGRSGVRWASDRPLRKAATDVVLVGHAWADRPDCRQVYVGLRVGPITKVVRVFGDRAWITAGGTSATRPARFEKVPLVWERAFGGVDATAGESVAENPVGVGFRGKRSKLEFDGQRLPNLEDPRNPLKSPDDRVAPAGFGFVAPNWQPRLRYAGTYDDGWLATRAPLLPQDYDERFQQVAPADQVLPGYLRGGEPVEVQNATPSGRLSFALPALRLVSEVQISGDVAPLGMVIDTVVIDGDRERVLLTWRGSMRIHGRVYDVERVAVALEGSA
jgi:hypothetical protein